MLIAIMSKRPTPKSGAAQESARLRLGELIQLADELGHRSHRLRGDGRRILDDVLANLKTLCNSSQSLTFSSAEADRTAFIAVRRELQSSWLRVDAMIDDLLHSAADELSTFANTAEIRIAACERAVRRRKDGNTTKAGADNGVQHSRPNLDRGTSERTEDS